MSDKKELNIIHLYPDLLNLYGDKGNIACLEMRLKMRGIDANIITYINNGDAPNFASADIIFLGGGSDREQEVVCSILKDKSEKLKEYIESGGVLLATCGGYEMLGGHYYSGDKKTEGLGALDIFAEKAEKRTIGNVILESDLFSQKIVGFENHIGKMNIGNHTPLGKVLCGSGNDGNGYEGIAYKNTIATYLHGPLLPKNPMLCDYILYLALKRKYADFTELKPLDDTIEEKANDYIVKTFAQCK